MKKSVFMLIAALSVILAGCSAFDSDPIEPNIIGTGNLQYDKRSGLWFVVIDSMQYTISNVTIPDRNPRAVGKTQNVKPIEGMPVTVFTSPRRTGLQVVAGRQSAAEIEEMYHTNYTILLVVFGLFLACIAIIAKPSKYNLSDKC